MQTRVLIVEDDQTMSRVIADNLRFEGYDVLVTGDGNDAITRSRSYQPDLVLLDVMLPNRNGLDLCGVLRQGGRVPVIIVSALGQKTDRIRGLKLGADDYVAKPFELDELLARIQAVLRRSRHGVDRLVLDNVRIDLTAMTATASGGREVHL